MNREQVKPLTAELFASIYTDKKFRNEVAYAHTCQNGRGEFKYKKTCAYPVEYIVTDEQIKEAKEEIERDKVRILAANKENLILIGMGGQYEGIEDTVGNHRVRGEFTDVNGIKVFVEFGKWYDDSTKNREFVHIDHCINKTVEEQSHPTEQHKFNNYRGLEKKRGLGEYTQTNLLRIVNELLDGNFKAVFIDNYTLRPSDYVSQSLPTTARLRR